MQNRQSSILFYCMIAMIAGLFFSRALLSVAMLSFIAVSFIHRTTGKQFQVFFSTPLLWGMSLLFFVPLLSGVWSSDTKQWLQMMQVKAPLFFLPLAFASPFRFTQLQWDRLGYIFIGIVTAGTIWSVGVYLADAAAINESYLRAKTMLTPFENDHVRFSWVVNCAILLAGWMYYQSAKNKNKLQWLWLIVIIWLVIFLHLLAARTGLFSFYISVLILAIWLIVKKLRWQFGALVMLLLISMPLIAWFTLPTFQNKLKYVKHELAYARNAGYMPGANDAVRVISLKAGYGLMKDEPVTGVGFGDILSSSKTWYEHHYPGMLERDKIYPSGEWMMYGAGVGIPGFIFFTIAMCIPFFTRVKNRVLWIMLNTTAAFSFAADIGLEVQFGVFIYSFIVLWYWKWLNAEKN